MAVLIGVVSWWLVDFGGGLLFTTLKGPQGAVVPLLLRDCIVIVVFFTTAPLAGAIAGYATARTAPTKVWVHVGVLATTILALALVTTTPVLRIVLHGHADELALMLMSSGLAFRSVGITIAFVLLGGLAGWRSRRKGEKTTGSPSR
jgi:hypothetical protein